MSSTSFRCDLPWAVAPLGPVESEAVDLYDRWLDCGSHAGMAYLEKYPEIRRDPRLLLEGARSIICVAFPYYSSEPFSLPIARYARGRDYHEVVREMLEEMTAEMPGLKRICVDTAPLRERYWAARAGLGAIGRNNQLIVPGFGSYCFIGSVLTTEELAPRRFAPEGWDPCGDCTRCVHACPGRVLHPDGRALDAHGCLSYLTIEHRGPLPGPIPVLYGCDACQTSCPHNQAIPDTPIAAFRPSDALKSLRLEDIASMSQADFSRTFRHSAIKRTKLTGLKRNYDQYLAK